MDETAENLLRLLQDALLWPTGGAARSREAMRDTERVYGALATRHGRRLHELVSGSHAWTLFERKRGRGRLPRMHELSQCEPLLQLMRDSGELADRERLLRERDSELRALWQQTELTDGERWLATEAIQEKYDAAVTQITATFRPFYRALRQNAHEARPLGGPRVRSRPLLQPPLMALLFRACHAPPSAERVFRHGLNSLQLSEAVPSGLDALAWDIAALAVSAFFVRTEGQDPDACFPFLLEDYAEWRGLDPRKRTPALRQEIEARLELLCSEHLRVESALALWQPDLETGRRVHRPVVASGPFLVPRGRFFRVPPVAGAAGQDAADGYLLSLGDWAQALVTQRAMRGLYPRRLAEYDGKRQQWERRIGWYLTFQMNNQASKMTFRDVARDGKTRTLITPQHALKMRTVLEGSHVGWEAMARTNPGKVIAQWRDALETLHRDGIIGLPHCLEGAIDGADLPARGRLSVLLERRFLFVPGRDLLSHIRTKRRKSSSS